APAPRAHSRPRANPTRRAIPPRTRAGPPSPGGEGDATRTRSRRTCARRRRDPRARAPAPARSAGAGRRPRTHATRSRPRRRTVELPFEPPPEHAFQPPRDAGQRIEVDSRRHAVALELPDEVLGRDVAGRVRRERAAAEPAHRRVEHDRTRSEG